MKNTKKHLLTAAFVLAMSLMNAQTLNWASLTKEHKHILNAHIAAEHGMVYGLGYGYHFNPRFFHIVPTVEYSFPSGNKLADDFKTKVGVQVNWVDFHHFQFNTRIQGIFRRYENTYVRMANFGSDLAGIIGYYRPKWFAAGEVGFDKAIITNFKHSQAYKDQFPEVGDGWYDPAMGGNLYFGMQAGGSFKQHDFYVRAGKMLTQDFKTSPLMPFYAELGYNFKFDRLIRKSKVGNP